MTISKGFSLGPYEILGLIGEGGMGQVWRARDSRIGRDVAVKVLAGSFTPGDEVVRRFEQEARAAGALNHPGLVTIFDVGTTDGSPYIVMELLEGQTLRETIGEVAPVRLPLRKAIEYATQIASALAVAHEKGIIHRDLKPENLFITPDRRVKILDFGLAKLAEAAEPDPLHPSRSRRHLTAAGMVVGTPGYMSPEQVRAEPLDHRTDIFSLGTVFYEMISGRPAFEAESVIETMHAVLNVDPAPLETIIPDIPQALEAIVRHCMEKNPRDRFQSARDLAFQLQTLPDVQTSVTGIRRIAPTKRRLPRVAIFALAAMLAAGAAGVAIFGMRKNESQETTRVFRQLTFADGLELFPTLAPDGKTFAYVTSESGNRDIYVQRVDGRTAINITSDSPADDAQPVFSPDGSQIAFRSERDGGGIFVMGVTGESVRRLTDFGYNPSWSPDGTRIVVSTAAAELRPQEHKANGDLWILDARTGAKRLVFRARDGVGSTDGTDALQPNWSPHGKRIAFWGVAGRLPERAIFTIDPDAAQPSKTLVRVTPEPSMNWNPVWSPDGQHLYFGSNRDGTLNLWRVAIDEETGSPVGAPEPVSLPASTSGNYAFAQNGEMVFTSVMRSYRLIALPVDATMAKAGEPRPLFLGSQEIESLDPSPDQQTIAFAGGGAQEDVFVANADGTRVRQLTNDAARDRGVSWAPNGKTLYFYSNRDGSYAIWRINADGSGLTRVTEGGNFYYPDVSPDGRTLAMAPSGLAHLDRPLAKRVETIDVQLSGPKWSPDGKQLVGTVFGGSGIVLYTIATRRVEKVSDIGFAPHWLPDGKHIVFFEKQSIGIVDLDTRRVSISAFVGVPGVELDRGVRLARDGSTLYVLQTMEQGDIWIVHLEKQ
ncbi:MAG TPA: protein kinase [Thermoanaerobaculia bacterium]|nr:protein kinase [Thermoanaerobaculia bacterium]